MHSSDAIPCMWAHRYTLHTHNTLPTIIFICKIGYSWKLRLSRSEYKTNHSDVDAKKKQTQRNPMRNADYCSTHTHTQFKWTHNVRNVYQAPESKSAERRMLCFVSQWRFPRSYILKELILDKHSYSEKFDKPVPNQPVPYKPGLLLVGVLVGRVKEKSCLELNI